MDRDRQNFVVRMLRDYFDEHRKLSTGAFYAKGFVAIGTIFMAAGLAQTLLRITIRPLAEIFWPGAIVATLGLIQLAVLRIWGPKP
jgi:hypothetical protein